MKRSVLIFSLLAFFSCDTSNLAVQPELRESPPVARSLVEGRVEGANTGFRWLPPIVRGEGDDAPHNGKFDPSLLPFITVEICEWGNEVCVGELIRSFTSAGKGSERLRISEEDGEPHYIVSWHTKDDALDGDRDYRIRVLVAGTQLGHIDVYVVNKGRDVMTVSSDEVFLARNGRTLPIKFWIEEEAVFVIGPSGGAITTEDGNVELTVSRGAVAEDVGITVQPARTYPADEGLVPGTAYDFGPVGLAFGGEVNLTVRYDPANIPDGIDESELRLQKVDGDRWAEVPDSHADVDEHAVKGSIDGFSTYAVVAAALQPVALIKVWPSRAQIEVGTSVQLTAVVTDADGNPLSVPVQWWSTDESVAAVDADGWVTAGASGWRAAFVVAQVGEIFGYASVRVRFVEESSTDSGFVWPIDPGSLAVGYDGYCTDWQAHSAGCFWLEEEGWRDANPFQRHENMETLPDGGERTLGYHLGADWNYGAGAADLDEPLSAIAKGTIIRVLENAPGMGNTVFIRHSTPFGEYVSVYAHVNWLSGRSLNIGSVVPKRYPIALIGDAGGLYSPHLHLEIRDAEHPDHLVLGTGYTDIQLSDGETGPQGQIDPNAFVTSHMPRPVGEPLVREFANFCTPPDYGYGFTACATIRIETQPLVDSDGGVVGTAGVVFVRNLQGVHPSDNSGGSYMAQMGIGGDVGLFGEDEGYLEDVWLVTDGLQLRRPPVSSPWRVNARAGVGRRYFDLLGNEPPLADWISIISYAVEGCDAADWGPDGSQPPVYASCAPDGFPGSLGLRFNTQGVWTAEDINVIKWEAGTYREGSPYALWARCWIFPSGEDPTEGTSSACRQIPIN